MQQPSFIPLSLEDVAALPIYGVVVKFGGLTSPMDPTVSRPYVTVSMFCPACVSMKLPVLRIVQYYKFMLERHQIPDDKKDEYRCITDLYVNTPVFETDTKYYVRLGSTVNLLKGCELHGSQ